MKTVVVIVGILIIMGCLAVYIGNKIEDFIIKYKKKLKQ